MKLRKLEKKDASLMLEWMHDATVTEKLHNNFWSKTIDDCEDFIKLAQNTERDIHLAVVDNEDIYMGTVSLKHITDKDAEFAIVIRACAKGKGYANYAMKEIIHIAFRELKLARVFWCVSPENIVALRFYDKNGYQRFSMTGEESIKGYTKEQIDYYVWYDVQ
ncbi:GNAT family N-acetyltransferase [Acetobacterium wieringae]|uniref:GNAT family N-acetyltransferase n=1 Tax=Acetobacterium wieringae TaxID=52694 RepID=A0A5D0WH38_9FIRM|nr:GNAT family N-acetyltransferase [Acetobacterium wieringae]TYC82193.1 GNAT family N-acetyltransferase [Acetobacterium wieringae]